jgi:AmpE protein
MSLLAILIGLAFDRLVPALDHWRNLGWSNLFTTWVRARLAGHPHLRGIATLLAIVLPPVLAIAMVQTLLSEWFMFLGFLFSVGVLVYCLGPKDQSRLVHSYLDASERGDTATAEATLQELLPHPLPETEEARLAALVETILIQTHERLLAILFWFGVLGPMGAVLYRLTAQQLRNLPAAGEADDAAFRHAVLRLHSLLAWIPTHLTVLGYAVMGSFVDALHAWREHDTAAPDTLPPPSHRLLVRVGLASMRLQCPQPAGDCKPTAVRETLGLCGRSLIAWVTVLALMTLGGFTA